MLGADRIAGIGSAAPGFRRRRTVPFERHVEIRFFCVTFHDVARGVYGEHARASISVLVGGGTALRSVYLCLVGRLQR